MATGFTVGGWFVSAILDTLVDKVASYAIKQHGFQSSLHEDLNKLRNSLIKVRAVIASAEKKQMKEEDSVSDLLNQLKEAAYDADDLLAEFEYQQQQLNVEGESDQASGFLPSALNFASNFFDSNNDLMVKMGVIHKRLDNITANFREVLEVLGDAGEKLHPEIRVRQETSSLLTESVVFGRERECEKLVELLLMSGENISGLSIIGIGGVGKTTLAQLIYNDLRVKDHFQLRIWVCVSDPFDVKRLTKEITESVSGERRSDLMSLNQLQLILKEKLFSKRFLLVLDDVWNQDRSKWEKLSAPLRFGEQGSKILVTARSRKVSDAIGAKNLIFLEGLPKDSYWSFFKRCAFGDQNSEKYPKLEAIGKVIAERLKGSPLAAKTIGGLLNSDLDEGHWKNIMESEVWELEQGESDILPILKLSYQCLPACLKQCFAFCSLFPKGFRFKKNSLIQMWMAHGFIRPKGSKRIEDLGSEYFNELLCISFFQQHSLWDNFYVMHDLLHDLAQSVSTDSCFRIEDENSQNFPSAIRHLSICIRKLNLSKLMKFLDLCRCRKLRTLLFIYGYGPNHQSALDVLLKELRCIRVMDLGYLCGEELPTSIGYRKQLRYLDISHTNIIRLPETLCRLYNLQVLKLKPRPNVCFPRGMRKLVNLRKLDANENSIAQIAEIGKLNSLQELSLFNVTKEPGHMIRELSDMSELHGKLCISNLGYVDTKEEACQAMLNRKRDLSALCFKWISDWHAVLGSNVSDADVLAGLQPHPNLKELKIISYGGVRYPRWLDASSLPNLESIFLANCKSLEQFPSLGQWPFLKLLRFGSMNAVRRVGHLFSGTTESNDFPALQKLTCWNMPVWEEWIAADSSPSFPCLHELCIKSCPKLRELPCLPLSLGKLRLSKVGLNALRGAWFVSDSHATNNRISQESNRNCMNASLSFVYIKKCSNLTSLGEFLLPNHLPHIKEIFIIDCEGLTFLPVGMFKDLLCLEYLELRNCPKLMHTDDNNLLLPSSLKKFILSSCGNLYMSLLGCLQSLTSLSTLKMIDCPQITSLQRESLHHLTALEELTIKDFSELRSIETLKCLTSLRTLTILGCPKLTAALPQNNELGEGLSSLRSLCIDDTAMITLELLGASQTTLQVLEIHDSQRLSLFTDGKEQEWLQNLTSLRELSFKSCPILQSLPLNLQNISTLQELRIEDCPELKSLPDNGLPGSLKELVFRNCHPDMKERLRVDTGADWQKIAHIRKIYLERELLR